MLFVQSFIQELLRFIRDTLQPRVHLRKTEFPLHSALPSSLVVYIIIIFL